MKSFFCFALSLILALLAAFWHSMKPDAVAQSSCIQQVGSPPPFVGELAPVLDLSNGSYQILNATEDAFIYAQEMRVLVKTAPSELIEVPQTFTLTAYFREPQSRAVDSSKCQV